MTIPLLAETPSALSTLSHIEALYTDLDGTLLGRGGSLLADGEGAPSTCTAEAIARVNAAELPVVIVTGRNRLQCNEITRLLGWRGYIAELGCVIVPDRGAKPLYNLGDWPLDLLATGETPYQFIERSGAIDRIAAAFPGKLEPHAPYHMNREATVLLRGQLDLEEARAILGELEFPVAIVDNGVVHPLATTLEGVDEVRAYHLMPPGVSKAGAVTLDLARRGLSRDQAASIGDAVTDVEMADAVALGVLVSNGLDDARVVAAAQGRANVLATRGRRGAGWAEFADAWLAAGAGAR